MIPKLEMLSPNRMMELILQSVGKSDLFKSDWERDFVNIVLEMFMTKGDFEHFVNYYGDKLDLSDFETYFKDYIFDKFDEDIYYELENELFGDYDDN